MATRGVSGIGLTAVAAGTVLATSGIKNATVADTLRALIKGQSPTGGTPTVPPAVAAGQAQPDTGSTGSAIADDALRYVGVPYKWAGATPAGWDCSGFVTWVLHHDLGLNLPSNVHTVTGAFLLWSGAVTIARSKCAAGDLVCWSTHIGIATSNKQMVDAPHTGVSTRVENIWPGATIRRVTAGLSVSGATPVGAGQYHTQN